MHKPTQYFLAGLNFFMALINFYCAFFGKEPVAIHIFNFAVGLFCLVAGIMIASTLKDHN